MDAEEVRDTPGGCESKYAVNDQAHCGWDAETNDGIEQNPGYGSYRP